MFQTSSIRQPSLRASCTVARITPRSAKSVVRCSVEGSKQAPKIAVFAGTSFLPAGVALAEETTLSPQLEKATEVLEKTFEVAGSVVKVAGDATSVAKDIAEKAAPYASEAATKLSPVKDAVSKFSERSIAPVLEGALSTSTGVAAQQAAALNSTLKDSGVDVAPAVDIAKKVIAESPAVYEKTLPVVQEFLSNDPIVLAQYGAATLAAYILLPVVGEVVVGGIRGYAGDLRAPEALDLLVSDSSACMLDIRLTDEVEAKGAIDLSKGSAKQLFALERFVLPDRSSYNDPAGTEAKLTALKIAALKFSKKGSPLVLLDQSGKQAKLVGKELANLGYGKVYLVRGGFDQWVASRLATKAAFSAGEAEVLSKKPAAARRPQLLRAGKVEVVSKKGGTKALPPSTK